MAFDSNFELKFSQLVDSRLQEKVPSLYPNRVGFQLVDVNDEQDMGVGVMAFVVNGNWLYVPAFFIKGQLKGLDLLYVKNRDLFVPLRDNWVSFLQKNEVKSLGFPVDKEEVKALRPNMINLVLSPHEKISNSKDSLIDVETLGKMMVKLAEYDKDLVSEIPKLGKKAFEVFVNSMRKDNEFANAILSYYTPQDLKKIAEDLDAMSIDGARDRKSTATDPDKEMKEKAEKVDSQINRAIVDSVENANPKVEKTVVIETPISTPDGSSVAEAKTSTVPAPALAQEIVSKVPAKKDELVIVTCPDSPLADSLTEKEKEILVRDGIFIKDRRSETTTVYNAEPSMLKFSNPTATGFYNVMMRDGGAVPMLIVFPNITKEDFAICRSYPYSSGGWGSSPVSCRRPVQPVNDVAVIDPTTPDRCWLRPAKDIYASPASKLPDELYNKLNGLEELTRKSLAGRGPYRRLLLVDRKRNAAIVNFNASEGVYTDTIGNLRFTDRDGKMYRNKGMIHIPSGTVAFTIESPCPHQFGDVTSVVYNIKKTAGLKHLKIYSDQNGFSITAESSQQMSLNKRAALLSLVQKHGIAAPLAKKMLKEASVATGVPVSKKYLLKYADMYDLNPGDPRGSAGATPQAPLETLYEALPARALETVTSAATKGIKEVMDTGVLASLAGTSNSMELLGMYLADLVKAMDKVGRLLFLYYWHQDEFKEQYGNQELTELEESLRSVFGSIGDLILFLKEKSIDMDTVFSGGRDTMSEDIGKSVE